MEYIVAPGAKAKGQGDLKSQNIKFVLRLMHSEKEMSGELAVKTVTR